MDSVENALRELYREKDKIDQAIQALEGLIGNSLREGVASITSIHELAFRILRGSPNGMSSDELLEKIHSHGGKCKDTNTLSVTIRRHKDKFKRKGGEGSSRKNWIIVK